MKTLTAILEVVIAVIFWGCLVFVIMPLILVSFAFG